MRRRKATPWQVVARSLRSRALMPQRGHINLDPVRWMAHKYKLPSPKELGEIIFLFFLFANSPKESWDIFLVFFFCFDSPKQLGKPLLVFRGRIPRWHSRGKSPESKTGLPVPRALPLGSILARFVGAPPNKPRDWGHQGLSVVFFRGVYTPCLGGFKGKPKGEPPC